MSKDWTEIKAELEAQGKCYNCEILKANLGDREALCLKHYRAEEVKHEA